MEATPDVAGATENGVESSRSARRRQRIASRRDLILAAAATSMATHGYERVTLEQIGEAVGLSPTGLYHYVGGKEDILAQLMVDSTEAIARDAEALAAAGDGAEARLSAIIRAHLRVSLTTPAGRVLSRHQDIVVSDNYHDILRRARREHERRLEEVIAGGTAEGVFTAADPRTTARFVLGALNGVPRWSPDVVTEEEVDRIAAQLVEHVVTGIGTATRAGRGIFAAAGPADAADGAR